MSEQPPRAHVPERDVLHVDANGLRFACLAWGDAAAPLALLIHGFPDTAHTWDVFGPELAAAGFRVVAPFTRGYAPTALPPRDADARTLGEDIVALIEALAGPSGHAVVVGHDWGADAAYAAAGMAPARVRRLVAVAIPHRGTLLPTPRLLWGLRHVFALSAPFAARRFARDDFAGADVLVRRWSPAWSYGQELEPVKNAFAAPGCLDAALGYYRAATVRVPDVLRARIGVPTRVLAGADDPNAAVSLFHDARRSFAAEYDVVAIPGGHFCHRESPRAFAAAVVPFLAMS